MEFLGTPTGGRWFEPADFKPGQIMFSCGVGEDLSFEIEAAKHGVEIYCFDPTEKSARYYSTLGARMAFIKCGIYTANTRKRFYYPSNENYVSCSIDNLQHTNKYFIAEVFTIDYLMDLFKIPHIDILKLDIEGTEYAVIDYLFDRGIYLDILMVEFHGNGDTLACIEKIKTKYTKTHQHVNDYIFKL